MVEIPKHVFDKEYSTQWREEVRFLEDKGIAYTYAKKHPKYPIIRYKYTKTPDLFLALAEFYNQVRIKEFHKSVEKVTSEIKKLPIEKGYIEVKAEDLSSGEKALFTEEDITSVLDDTE